MVMPARMKQRLWIMLGFILVLVVGGNYQSAPPPPVVKGDISAEKLFEQQRSEVQIRVSGEVIRLLAQDNADSQHQRFIIELASGQTLLVTHNIDLAPRIEDLAVGDEVQIYGEYIWNEQGGLLHWTHHDPENLHPHGWIRHQGKLYQ